MKLLALLIIVKKLSRSFLLAPLECLFATLKCSEAASWHSKTPYIAKLPGQRPGPRMEALPPWPLLGDTPRPPYLSITRGISLLVKMRSWQPCMIPTRYLVITDMYNHCCIINSKSAADHRHSPISTPCFMFLRPSGGKFCMCYK